jgi:hypothetical protein
MLGRFITWDIKVDQRDGEHNGATSKSATQKTTVYPIALGDTIVHLIDTLGIRDTQGVEKDRKNMSNILSTLKNYKKIHGILILLKPNYARLTV